MNNCKVQRTTCVWHPEQTGWVSIKPRVDRLDSGGLLPSDRTIPSFESTHIVLGGMNNTKASPDTDADRTTNGD